MHNHFFYLLKVSACCLIFFCFLWIYQILFGLDNIDIAFGFSRELARGHTMLSSRGRGSFALKIGPVHWGHLVSSSETSSVCPIWDGFFISCKVLWKYYRETARCYIKGAGAISASVGHLGWRHVHFQKRKWRMPLLCSISRPLHVPDIWSVGWEVTLVQVNQFHDLVTGKQLSAVRTRWQVCHFF